MACHEVSDERCAVRLAGVEGGGIALAIQNGLFPYHPPETVKVFPVLIPSG